MSAFPVLQCGASSLTLDRPRVMGILNVTPDSFSDGGLFATTKSAVKRARQLIDQGADIIDVGGESTRPGAASVAEQQEIDRVVPVIEAIRSRFDTIVSVDTSKAAVMLEAVNAGAGIINDVRALREPKALTTAATLSVPVCLMHMQGQPRTMQLAPSYDDVTREVETFLQQRCQACLDAGIDGANLLIDPGFGFGKNLEHNLTLLDQLARLGRIAPLVTGLSRKRMFAEILGDDCADRVTASVTGAILCVQRGAAIVRVHDVRQTVDALKVWNAFAAMDQPAATV